jgi:TonB family protein
MESMAFITGAALKSSAVLLVAWAAAQLLRNRSAAARHLLWTAASAAILALPFLSLGLPALAVPAAGRLAALAPTVTFRADTAAGAERPAVPSPAAVPFTRAAPSPPAFNWKMLPPAIWGFGAALGLSQLLAAAALLWRRRRLASTHPAQQEARMLARELGIESPVEILEGPADSMPMACGLLRPAIFLPTNAAAWSEERRRMVVLHELAHVRRGDMATHVVARLALSLHWWNPLAWMAWREFLKERERAADDLVLLSGARASDYAGHLLEIARAMQPARSLASAAVAMARRSELEGRLLAILDARRNRRSMARVSGMAAVLAAVVLVAPFAAMRAQDSTATPAATDPDPAIRAALASKDPHALEQAALVYERSQQWDAAQKLLDTALAIREQAAGQHSVEYGEGLVKLGVLASKRGQMDRAAALYAKAASAMSGSPAVSKPLTSLGVILYTQKKYDQAREDFLQAQTADPAHKVTPLVWLGLTEAKQEGHAAAAESYFHQAMALAVPDSVDAGVAADLYANFLRDEGRQAEADAMRQQADSARRAARSLRPQPAGAGVYRVGNGVTAPLLLSKPEPEYSEEARAAKYQGTVILSMEVAPDGLAHNIQVVQGLGMGLDEEAVAAVRQWKFQPGTKDQVPVTVRALIEVNFRLL